MEMPRDERLHMPGARRAPVDPAGMAARARIIAGRCVSRYSGGSRGRAITTTDPDV